MTDPDLTMSQVYLRSKGNLNLLEVSRFDAQERRVIITRQLVFRRFSIHRNLRPVNPVRLPDL